MIALRAPWRAVAGVGDAGDAWSIVEEPQHSRVRQDLATLWENGGCGLQSALLVVDDGSAIASASRLVSRPASPILAAVRFYRADS